VSKASLRVETYGAVDETNACIGLVRLHTSDSELDPVLARIQNELFDWGRIFQRRSPPMRSQARP
jgi:cob(I)alamin adenosyltransferase